MDVVRRGFERERFSCDVVDLFMAATRGNTNSAYASAWRVWSDWCAKSIAYSTIGVYRSALFQTLPHLNGFPIGKHPMILLLMKGIRNQNPPKLDENASFSVGAFASKLATLLSLATLYRASELAAIDKESQLDPGRCLNRYCDVTEKYRTSDNSDSLFIASVGQHLQRFSGHCTRGAAASKVAASEMSVESILKAGHWSSESESTFTRFYRREASISPSTSEAGAFRSLSNSA
ncbi:hypothetical protein GHT06_020432 [Daphnia sinensis]|uniref:Core-binding (CB) domain-containing protein n=1 Tax=Daphnia sinensis TaxID=1820382 RepID=A0AAD5PMW3_9CRUS|nr:hypothetical protein GHT06_020432 [Daphnia sinensis]